jgi:hypothetical protein
LGRAECLQRPIPFLGLEERKAAGRHKDEPDSREDETEFLQPSVHLNLPSFELLDLMDRLWLCSNISRTGRTA